MEHVTIQINGKKLESKHGKTILEVAAANGIHIPTLCYVEGLAAYGGCRVCLVEIASCEKLAHLTHNGLPTSDGEQPMHAEPANAQNPSQGNFHCKSGDLAAACTTKVADGMIVDTSSPRAMEARRFVVELLLADHQKDCITCDKWGDCQLQRLAEELGLEGREIRSSIPELSSELSSGVVLRTPGEISPNSPKDLTHRSGAADSSGERGELAAVPRQQRSPIRRDSNACTHCGKCVRICREVQKVSALCFEGKGVHTFITTPFRKHITDTPCVLCGMCVAACPAGALQRTSAFDSWRAIKKKT